MEEAIGNFQSLIFTFIIYLLIAGFIGYVLTPVFLKKFGVNKQTRLGVTKLTVGILFVIAFILSLKSL